MALFQGCFQSLLLLDCDSGTDLERLYYIIIFTMVIIIIISAGCTSLIHNISGRAKVMLPVPHVRVCEVTRRAGY